MAHRIPTRLLVFVGAFALAATSAFAQAGVAGNWTLAVDSPQGAMTVGLVLKVEGEAVTGSISSDMGEAKFAGTVKDSTVKFTFDMAGPQGPMSITTTATISGDELKGEMDYGMGTAPFTGKRAEQ